MKVAVISVSPGRLSEFTTKNRIETRFDVFGVNGKAMSADAYFRAGVAKKAVPLSPSEVGCSLSHLEAMRAFLNSDARYLCVLEDDIEFVDAKAFNAIDDAWLDGVVTSNAPVLLHLGGQEGLPGRWKIHGTKIAANDVDVWRLALPSLRWLWRTCGYIVNREMARLVIASQEADLTLADSWRVFTSGVSPNVYYANLVNHPLDLAQSAIEAERRQILSAKKLKTYVSKFHGLLIFIGLRISPRFQKIH